METNTLSTFRTRHRFLYYAEFTTVEEFLFLHSWSGERKLTLYILGNGSNTLFVSRTVHTLVLRNRLEPRIRWLDDTRAEVCSAVPIMALLRQCHERHLESFYYLAAAPATVGGAIAMNAGRGRNHNMSVFDFLESLSYVDDGHILNIPADRVDRGYRWTPFTGVRDKLIVSVVFRFRPGDYEGNPIRDRLAYAQEVQDLSEPNCGSVFKECHPGLQRRLRGLRVGKASFSRKTPNWLLNHGESPWPLHALICISKAAHRLLGRKAVLELVEVA